MIAVKDHAFAYNNVSVRIREEGPYQKFRDEMTSKEMIAYFKGDQILQLTLMNMATTIKILKWVKILEYKTYSLVSNIGQLIWAQ